MKNKEKQTRARLLKAQDLKLYNKYCFNEGIYIYIGKNIKYDFHCFLTKGYFGVSEKELSKIDVDFNEVVKTLKLDVINYEGIQYIKGYHIEEFTDCMIKELKEF